MKNLVNCVKQREETLYKGERSNDRTVPILKREKSDCDIDRDSISNIRPSIIHELITNTLYGYLLYYYVLFYGL